MPNPKSTPKPRRKLPDGLPPEGRDGGHFRGNKAGLPSKPCQCCGRPMTWRKKWAKNWNEVKHCSSACQRQSC